MISVIIPTHNRCELIGRAIDSVLKQTYDNFEIIIVSDGSTDDTSNKVKSYTKNHSNIKFIEYFPSKGGNYARNLGAKVSKGEYVAYLDDDDEWMPDKLQRQIEIMNSDTNISLVYTGCRICYVHENVEYLNKPTKHGDLSQVILFDNCIGSTSTVLIKKSIFEKVGYFDEQLVALQDYDLWIRISQLSHIGVVPEPMIKYYNYTGSKQVSALTEKYEKSFSYINNKYRDLYSAFSTIDIRKKRNNEYFLLGNKAMRNGNPADARKYFLKILKRGFSKKALIYYLLTFTSFKLVLKIRSIL